MGMGVGGIPMFETPTIDAVSRASKAMITTVRNRARLARIWVGGTCWTPMSAYTLVFAGTTPIGNLFTGFIAQKFGAPAAFLACGGVILALLVPINLYRVRLGRAGLAEGEH